MTDDEDTKRAQAAWAADQLDQAGWRHDQDQLAQVVNTAVRRLLDLHASMILAPQTSAKIVELFSKLALGHALVQAPAEEVWVPAQRGQVRVEDTIRVCHDAFDGDRGMAHNGRRGVIIAIRRGDIWVCYRDSRFPETPPSGIPMPVEMLEKRVR